MSIASKNPRLAITSASTYWHRSEIGETDTTLWELGSLKEAAGDQVEIGAPLYSEPIGAKVGRLFKQSLPLNLGGVLATGAVGAGLVAAGALALPVAAAMAVGLPLGITAAAITGKVREDLSRKSEQPTGLTVQTTGPEHKFENLDDSAEPSDALRETLMLNMKRYPAARQVVHLNGHGQGNKAIAGLEAEKANAALQEAVRKSGRPINVVFNEACFNANFEALHGQADSADFAVAVEDQAPKSNAIGGRIPLEQVFSQALEASDDRQAAIQMARAAGAHFDRDEPAPIAGVPWNQRHLSQHKRARWTNIDSTVSAFDLKALKQKLSPALDKVGKAFTRALKSDYSMKEIFDSARRDNAIDGQIDLVDMGGFLEQVMRRAPEHAPDIDQALKAMDDSILYTRTGAERPMSGLSFHSRPGKLLGSNPASKAFADSGLPEGWTDFVERAF